MNAKDIDYLMIQVLIEFEKTALNLINKLAFKYNLDLKEDHPFGRLISRHNNLWKGMIDEEWSYLFHGDACTFTNKKTNQFLDVKINRKGNFGTIDNYYLYCFYKTTNSFHELICFIQNENDFNNIIKSLELKNIIIDIEEPDYISTRILNKNYLN